ncbi:MAG: hypothetical protein ACYCXA_06600 [Actinomycetes bacterium]
MPVKTTWDVGHECGHCQDHVLSAKRASERAAGDSDEWLAGWRAQDLSETDTWQARADLPVLAGSDKAADVEELVTDAASHNVARASEYPY